ncbi:hypothetical protein RRG08_059421 [Elysia crispata]|uniref:Uncharacterized protein n=1 Tax=Elysia crispata TaxID=231223 RepID=A0AAE1A5D6_9GAST|nr:hypothetical protein RRG08_059421 [Elysia crispata]
MGKLSFFLLALYMACLLNMAMAFLWWPSDSDSDKDAGKTTDTSAADKFAQDFNTGFMLGYLATNGQSYLNPYL